MIGYDRLYVAFIYYFNMERDYFECHEVMEELWLEEGRKPLYQGLLQVAVGLYHHRNGNVGGAIKLFTQGIDKLQSFPRHTLGIDLAAIVADSRIYVQKLLQIEQEPFEFYDLNLTIVDPELEAKVQVLIANPPKRQEDETV
jgi:predicted metal-dependent hydrolase